MSFTGGAGGFENKARFGQMLRRSEILTQLWALDKFAGFLFIAPHAVLPVPFRIKEVAGRVDKIDMRGLRAACLLLYRAGGFVFLQTKNMAVVAQLVEPRIVIPVVAGSSPVDRPILRWLRKLRMARPSAFC